MAHAKINPMKKYLIVRHAESLSNAGEKTDSHDTIPLTEKGRQQAIELAETLNITPELIVISSYSRTHETAAPFIAKHPDVPVEIWDVHEFTYLDGKVFNGTTKEERSEAVMDYWENKDIDWQASETAESFSSLLRRIERFVEKLKSRKEKTIVVFAHGRFIQNLKLYLREAKKHNIQKLTPEMIQSLKREQFEHIRDKTEIPIKNTSVHEIELD